MPLVSRACTSALANPPPQRRLAKSDEEICIEYYNECVQLCGPAGSTDHEQCVGICYEQFERCIEAGPRSTSDAPTCDPEAGYCGYDDDPNYEYEEYPGDEGSDWTCETSDDDYDDSSTDWSCGSSDDYPDDSSSDGGWDCSADNYDEGDSGDDGDWGEDWGERSPAGGDGIDSPDDLPR